ncbi:S-norcoclaurine synthase-like [Dorcoceras hygrometricum]|uniref:S-norcoclaurine synthase-like n=1 Tax=Dorcoceras hygrometricum TaxID=472368 RepID=A0A2Z7CGC9_9LAMI|nr:S-norcoclaurine synthase-like [Dorcoceras hygrometricum]
MFGTASDEKEVNVPASEAWKVYGSLLLAKIAGESLKDYISKTVAVGDGGVGTTVEIFYPAGTPGATSYKEKFTVVDNSRRMKETEVVEGGFLDLGFNCFRVRLEVIEKDKNSCITKSTIEYEINEEAATNADLVSIKPLTALMECVADYLVKDHSKDIPSANA